MRSSHDVGEVDSNLQRPVNSKFMLSLSLYQSAAHLEFAYTRPPPSALLSLVRHVDVLGGAACILLLQRSSDPKLARQEDEEWQRQARARRIAQQVGVGPGEDQLVIVGWYAYVTTWMFNALATGDAAWEALLHKLSEEIMVKRMDWLEPQLTAERDEEGLRQLTALRGYWDETLQMLQEVPSRLRELVKAQAGGGSEHLLPCLLSFSLPCDGLDPMLLSRPDRLGICVQSAFALVQAELEPVAQRVVAAERMIYGVPAAGEEAAEIGV